jgi:hypothetical protein
MRVARRSFCSWAVLSTFELSSSLEPGFRCERLITYGVVQLHAGPDLEPESKPLDLVGYRRRKVPDANLSISWTPH